MKIKQKKQLNLPQLIEWGWENDVTGAMFSDDRVEAKRIRFEVGILVSIHGDMNKQDTFTVIVEEEITEDTEFDIIVLIEKDSCSATWANNSINKLKDNRSKEFHAYIDGEFKLIWTREKGLVE